MTEYSHQQSSWIRYAFTHWGTFHFASAYVTSKLQMIAYNSLTMLPSHTDRNRMCTLEEPGGFPFSLDYNQLISTVLYNKLAMI